MSKNELSENPSFSGILVVFFLPRTTYLLVVYAIRTGCRRVPAPSELTEKIVIEFGPAAGFAAGKSRPETSAQDPFMPIWITGPALKFKFKWSFGLNP
jgi:hypothetical protein